MLLYLLGELPWPLTQLYYHALARLGRPALVLCWPDRPYLSVGYSQDAAAELDLDHCRAAGLAVFRRQVGGGAVYLDGEQVFWQLVLPLGHPAVSLNRAAFYRRFLAPVAAAYRDLGVAAEVSGPCDLAAAGRKICGTGAGEIGECAVFVGNLMRSFAPDAMARALAAPSPAFRSRFLQCLHSGVTSLAGELGPERAAGISRRDMADTLARRFAGALGPLQPAGPDPELDRAAEQLGARLLSPAWTYRARKPRPLRRVKVRAGCYLCHGRRATAAGPIEALYGLDRGRLDAVALAGELSARDRRRLDRLGLALQGLPPAQAPDTARALLAGRGGGAGGLADIAPGDWVALFPPARG